MHQTVCVFGRLMSFPAPCSLVFSTFIPKVQIEAFLYRTLLLEHTLASACKIVKKMFEDAPRNTKTRFKNALHGYATKGSS